ncbi:MAG: hypothetical protein QF485_00165 [Arenicellales bacterium]|jgi:hypothetical protein|nr:hypothetical protein [Arenicellales bacterium]|tara:strand:+ start:980 stop:1156 length:177 start_codon:yes stop_codon:yes gene_type:complete
MKMGDGGYGGEAIDGAPFMAEDLAKAREAALADPQGAALARALVEIANNGAGVTNPTT